MSNDTPKPSVNATKPTVLQIPLLGYAAHLGELYNQHSGQFLGVQLYPEADLNIAETDVKHTDLSLSLSTTLEDKASLLTIDAHISLQILGGLIDISGSASYVKDVRSNTREQAYALALKMRLSERRILFAQETMGRNVLDVVQRDFIGSGSATHFVSSIVYGGNLIINLVARQYKFSAVEKLDGSLGWAVDKVKGSLRFSGGPSVNTGDELKGMNDKFDLIVHGDVALEHEPTTPQEVLDAIPTAASLIRKDGGVPISVTLQPIPEALIRGTMVYEVDKLLVEQVLKAFAQLDDLRCRFTVLIDSIKEFAELVPELARAAGIVADKYAKDHGLLLHDLREFLNDYQHGKPLPSVFEGGKKDDGSYDIPVLKSATDLYEFHLKLDDASHQPSQYYPSTLVGLEEEFLKFRNFVFDIQELRDTVLSLADSCKEYVCLNSIDDVTKAMRHKNRTPVFVMTCFTPKQPGQPSAKRLHPDLAIVQFLTILRENNAYFNDSSTPARILYAETPEFLKRRIPNLGEYSQRENPFFFISHVDSKGKLSWSDPPQTTVFSSKLRHESSGGKRGDLTHPIQGVNGREPFSVQVWAKASASSSPSDSTICLLRPTASESPFLRFHMQPLGAKIERNWGEAVLKSRKDPPSGAVFVVTFVQDLETEDGPKWSLYLGEEEVESLLFTDVEELLSESTSVEFAFPADNITWWRGEVCEVRAFSYALKKERVAEEIQKGRTQNLNECEWNV